MRLLEEGMKVSEIAEKLGMTDKCIQAYMPYSKGEYGKPDKPNDAINTEIYRKRNNAIPRSVVNTKTVKDKWLNKYELGGLYIREYASDRTTVEYLKPNSPEATPSFMRLVFAKEKKNNSPYKFKGVYVFDSEKSKERNHVFRRISQSVLLKGEPVTEVAPVLNN